MDGGCLSFTTVSPPSRPSTLLRQNGLQTKEFQTRTQLIPRPKASWSSTSRSRSKRRNFSVKASHESFPTKSLSSNWDVSNYTAPSWLPRFEELDSTNMLLRQRIVFLASQVDDATADFIISQLLFLDAEDQEKDIKLFINSPGGSITAGMGIYDAMKMCKADISTICMGLAASMGAFLLASGTKGKRFCMPNARVMIHQPLGVAMGGLTDMSIRVKEIMYHKAKLNKILSLVSGQSEEKIDVDTNRDYFMNAWEAKEYGLVDAVIDDGKPGLVAPTTEPIPPPEPQIWRLWRGTPDYGIKRSKRPMPSEERLLQNGFTGGKGDDEKGTEQREEKRTPT